MFCIELFWQKSKVVDLYTRSQSFGLHFKTKIPGSLSMSYVSKVFANFNSAFNLSFDMTTTSPYLPSENFFSAYSNMLFISFLSI